MIILAAILGLVALATSWYRPSWGACVLLAMLPSYQLRFSVAGLPSTMLEVILLATLIGAGIHWATERSAFPKLSPKTIGLSLIWLAIGSLGVAVAQDSYAALGLYRAYVVEPLLTLPLWLAVWQEERDRRKLLLVTSVQLALFGTVAVLQRLHVVSGIEPWISETPQRVTSLFSYPNAAALYAAPLAALLAGIFLTVQAKYRWEKTLWIIGAVSGILTCVLANSRGALLALGAAALVLGAWSNRRAVWWSVCAALVAALVLIPATRAQFTSVFTLRDTSTDVRSVLWQGTWRLLEAHPITGAGLGGFPTLYAKYKLPQHVELLEYPHNVLLNAWVEFGILGAAFTLGVVFWLAFALFRRLRARDSWAVGTLAAWIVVLVHGLVDVPYFKNDLAVLTVFLLVIAAPRPQSHNKIPPA
jgi:O-antigen ligase